VSVEVLSSVDCLVEQDVCFGRLDVSGVDFVDFLIVVLVPLASLVGVAEGRVMANIQRTRVVAHAV